MEEGGELKESFRECRDACERIEAGTQASANGGGRDQANEERKRIAGKVMRCMQMVESLGILSANESKEDILTEHLQFLLLQYFLGVCYANMGDPDPGSRLENVQNAILSFRRFAAACLDKDLLESDIAKRVESMVESDSVYSKPRTVAREEKIAQYKRQKEIKQKMEGLESSSSVDEEEARELALLHINSSVLNALQHQNSLCQEVEILKFAKDRPEGAESTESINRRREEQAKQFHALKGTATALQAERQRLADGVFRPSHILPTMTVEEFGMLELERMKEAEASKSRHAQGEAACSSEHGDSSDDDDAVKKAREWDDFKDENPRGWGNSKLRPCA